MAGRKRIKHMKIVIDIRPLAGAGYGGVGEYIRHLLPPLFAEGRKHSFALFSNSRSKLPAMPLTFQRPNVTLQHFSYSNKVLTFATRYLQKPRIDKLVGGADVLFAPHFLPAPVSTGCRKVVTFHDLSFEYLPECFDARRRLWHRYIAPRKQAHNADALIAVSDSTRQDLEGMYGVRNKKITTIHSGINEELSTLSYDWAALSRRFGVAGDYILFLGTLEPRKNLSVLIRSFNILASTNKDIRLVLAGAPGWKYQNIRQERSRSPYRDRIIVTGPVTEPEKAALLSNASLFVYPSLFEGFGFPPLEAMRFGIPTLVSHATSLPEIIGNAGLLIDPYRSGELAETMNEALNDEELRTLLAQRGRRQAEHFSWKKAARQTLRVLENA